MQYDNNNNNTTITTSPNNWMTTIYDDNNNDNIITDKSTMTNPISTKIINTTTEKSKRKQVKNACVNCQKACKKCDDGRPCKRCVKLGLTATCRDSDRKERKKGVKRGPYKKRQAYTKEKPTVYPKLTEQHWKQPIYENVPQVLSHNNNQSIYNDFYDDASYCVPSQRNSLSPTSSSSFVDESDETLHYAYGYGYTNNHTTTITTTSSPSATSMLDHQTISGNITPISYSWDDNFVSSSGNSSPIGCNPIMMNDASSIVQFQAFPTTTDIIYQTQLQKDPSIIIQQPSFDLTMLNQQQQPPPTTSTSSFWYNDMPLEYHQPIQHQQQHYFEYSIPSQQYHPSSWAYTN